MSVCPCGDKIHLDDLRADLNTHRDVLKIVTRQIEELERKIADAKPCTGFMDLLKR